MNPFKKDKKQLSIFITAGFPNLDSTAAQLLSLQESGVDFIELGIPFSDPMADGPIIQESSAIALKNGMQMNLLFEQFASVKDQLTIPIVLMGYFNPILQYGIERFIEKAEMCNVTGFIIPDLSFEIAQSNFKDQFSKTTIPLVYLITPTTSNERIAKISEHSKNGFIYLVTSNATTGQNKSVSLNQTRLKEIKAITKDVPLFLGFGIKTKEDVAAAQLIADGAIIGSEYILKVTKNTEKEYIDSLLNSSICSNIDA